MTRYLLYVLGVTFALERQIPLFNLGPLGFTTVEILIGLILFVWVAECAYERRWPRLPSRWVMLPLLIWFGVMVISTLLAPASRWNAGLFLARMAAGVFVAWAVFDRLETPAHQKRMIMMVVGGGLLVAVSGLAELTQNPLALRFLSGFKVGPTQAGELLRLSGVLSYATIMTAVLELTILVGIGLLAVAAPRERIGIGVALTLMLTVMVLTLSRSGVIGVLAGAGVYAFFAWRWRERHIMWAAGGVTAILVTVVAGVLLLNPNTLLRLRSETEAAWYQVEYGVPADLQARPGEMLQTHVEVHNTGARTWQPNEGFMLGYHLYDAQGDTLTYDGARTPLEGSVTPRTTVTLEALVAAPTTPGTYTLEWDMVHEQVTWFSWKGAPTPATHLEVSGPPVENPVDIAVVPPPTDARVIEQTPGRLTLWRVAWLMFLDRPLIGVGPDNFRWRYGDYANLETWNTAIHANNLYLELLADTGVLGFTAFMWFSATLGIGLFQTLHHHHHVLLLGLAAALAAWYIHGMVDYFYEFTPTYTLYWMIVGLALGGIHAHRV